MKTDTPRSRHPRHLSRSSRSTATGFDRVIAAARVLALLATGLVGLIGLLFRFLVGAYLVALAIFFALSSPWPRLPWRRRPRLFRLRRLGW